MCEHEKHEDCMNCAVCGECKEDLDSNDVCIECGGVDEDEAKPLHSYLFDLGNSTDGPIGFCARVNAPDKEHALAIIKAEIVNGMGDRLECSRCHPAVEYLNVYFNAEGITLDDINDDETEDIEPEENVGQMTRRLADEEAAEAASQERFLTRTENLPEQAGQQ